MKKTLYTLATKDYAPEITSITFFLMKQYCYKIKADFYVIQERKWPDLPIGYEKFQIFDLSKEHGNDWNIYFDSDALIHPDFFDISSVLNKDMTCSYGTDFTPFRFRPDKYFWRDGRFIGKGNWCLIASDWCTDIWHPLDDIPLEEAFDNIFPLKQELDTVITRGHLLDDYVVSRNIARYGLKHILIPEVLAYYKVTLAHLAHQYTLDIDQKIIWIRKQMSDWGLKCP